MQCRNCGTDNEADSGFCQECGQALEDARPVSRGLTPEEHIRVGELIYAAFKHEESGDLDDAILACQGALALNDASPQAHVLLATLYQSKGDIAAAMYEYGRALELDPQNVSTQLKLENLKNTPVLPAAQPAARGSWLNQIGPYVPYVAFGAVFVIVLVGLTMFFTGSSNVQSEAPSGQRTFPQTTAPIQPYAQTPYPQAQAPAVQRPQPQVPSPPAPAPQQNVASQPTQRAPVVPVSRPAPVQPPLWDQPPALKPQPIMTPVLETRPAPPPTRPVAQPPPPTAGPPAPSVDPEQRAIQLQRAFKYDEAISAYRDALDRTSDAGRIYQQIAICDQRLGRHDAAVDSYTRAIRSYRDQLAAGREPAEVQRNIRACEAGIAVSKGH